MKKTLIVLTLILTVSLSGCYSPQDTDENLLTEEDLIALIEELIPEATVGTTYDLASFEQAINDMIEEVKTGVVGIIASSEESSGSGSGVIYKKDGNDYFLVTNQHVVDGAETLVIIFEKNGMLFQIDNQYVTLVGEDPTTDLAVVKFTSNEDFAVVPFANSYEIELGDIVFAIGNPLGFEYYGTVTMGVISGLSRYVKDDIEDGFDATLLQHDAAISPGNSGGALLNTNGELVGINNMKIVDDDVTSIGFAIPSNTVERIATDLEDDGELSTPYLGISTIAQVNECGVDFGVCISVIPGMPAEAAELRNEDVIVGYLNDGETEYRTINNFNDLREAILNSSIGDKIRIQYVRDGVTETTEDIELVEKP